MPRSAAVIPLDAPPNARGGAVRPAERALADARHAFAEQGETAVPLLRAVHALRAAGWLGAHRFTDVLLMIAPLVAADALSEPGLRRLFGVALDDFHAALELHSLRELCCSPTLHQHYCALTSQVMQHVHGMPSQFDDIVLTARPVPPASLRSLPAHQLAHLRARFERALLPVLRTHEALEGAAGAAARAAMGELEACLAELAGSDPYDFWRLAAGCARALRVSGQAFGDTDARRFFARCNLALADQGRGIRLAPRSLVRATLALLWRDYARFGAAAEDADQVELLLDYGLTVDWHVAGTQNSEALWEGEAGAARSGASATKELGVLTVNAHAYEDFLQIADSSIAALSAHAKAADQPEKADPSEALQAGDAAYRLGAAANALGLGHVALLADALGLAWRRRAHAAVSTPAVRAHVAVEAPAAPSLEHAAEALRAMLHKIAAGVAPPDGSVALAALARVIEQGGAAPWAV